MSKIFLATSFSGQVGKITAQVLPEVRQFITQILEGLRSNELEVFAAIEHEGWMIAADVSPEIGVQKDLSEVDASDTLIALVHDKPSAGVQFELGYAIAKGKKVILACAADEHLAYFNEGVASAGLVTVVSYDDVASLVNQLVIAANAPAERV
jgi:nucleoside 2-deoxyribosyltransferase